MTDIRFAFETLQRDHDAKTFGLATEGHSLTRQEFADECDIDVLMAYGRCLRPALYSSLRSSPSHPTGVSALRVAIAIASARFARKQWGASRKSPPASRVCWLGSWTLGTSDRGGQDKAHKVRAVGWDGDCLKIPAIRQTLRNIRHTLRLSAKRYRRSSIHTL